jgi:hypothetical protein
MRRSHCIPLPPHPQVQIETALIELLQLQDFRDSVTKRQLARLLWVASVLLLSISGVARWKNWHVGLETIRLAWKASLPKTRELLLQRALPALWSWIPRGLRRRFHTRGVQLAFDYHARPFYGQRTTPHLVGGQPKKSTHWFWTYATATIVEAGQRWTVAVTYVSKSDTPATVLARLLEQLRQAQVKVRLALLDSGFYSANVVHLLQQQHVPFVMPALRRGTKTTGTQPYFATGTRGWFAYTWRGKTTTDPRVTVQLACLAEPKKKGQARRQLVYACSQRWGTLRQVWEVYRTRFGIETSYRQLGEVVPKTTSKDPVWRLALILVAVLLRNVWVTRQRQWASLTLRGLLLVVVVSWLGVDLEQLNPDDTSPDAPDHSPQPFKPKLFPKINL